MQLLDVTSMLAVWVLLRHQASASKHQHQSTLHSVSQLHLVVLVLLQEETPQHTALSWMSLVSVPGLC